MISGEKGSVVKPPLYGLVLAGGKSVRMGQDKGVMKWHGKEQRYYVADLLKEICEEVFISCRPEQKNEIHPGYKTLVDTVDGSGPLIAILSAFNEKPGVAWLVIACDLPLLDLATLQYLNQNRDIAYVATTFESPFDGLPEPLITIWEPNAHHKLLSHVSEGFSCPRKALIRNIDKVKLLSPTDPDALINANTPDDVENVRQIINNSQ